MEKRLSQWIRETTEGCVPVQTWVVADEGKSILNNIYPLSFPDSGEFSDYPFKFSNNWHKGCFKRHKFSLRKHQIGRTSPQIRRSGLRSQNVFTWRPEHFRYPRSMIQYGELHHLCVCSTKTRYQQLSHQHMIVLLTTHEKNMFMMLLGMRMNFADSVCQIW